MERAVAKVHLEQFLKVQNIRSRWQAALGDLLEYHHRPGFTYLAGSDEHDVGVDHEIIQFFTFSIRFARSISRICSRPEAKVAQIFLIEWLHITAARSRARGLISGYFVKNSQERSKSSTETGTIS